jgi:FkbM family methyltransferase
MLNAIYFPKLDHSFSPFEALWIPEILEELWIKNVYKDIFGERTDMVVIDAGANVGLATQYFYDHCKQIYSIEPSPENFEALAKNKEVNGWDKVKLYNAALANHDGNATLSINSGNRTANSITNNWGHGNENVKAITIKTIFDENKIESLDFLKMDIEGAEDQVIESPEFAEIAPKIKAMIVEYHNGGWERLHDIITQLGFQSQREATPTVNFLYWR